jgi:hypothetical protein
MRAVRGVLQIVLSSRMREGLSPGPERGAIKRIHQSKLSLRLALVALLGGLLSGDSIWWDRRAPQPAIEIFQGVTYGSARLDITSEGGGMLHWVRIDLSAPGIELYVTPLDPTAVAQGWQYRLRPIEHVVASEDLAVAVNGSLFTWEGAWLLPRSGDLARAVETVVADHVVSHVWEHAYVLWFDDALAPHLRPTKPPDPGELARAKWGIGGQAVWLQHGQVWPGAAVRPMRERRSQSTGSKSSCFLRSPKTSRRGVYCKNLPAWGPSRGCCSTAVTPRPWRLAKARKQLRQGSCTAGGDP